MSGFTKSGTTPFPNLLLDEAMPRLKDTEWRVLCMVVRQTLGHYDPATKGRKERDWITRAQLKTRTGRTTEALALAIETLVSGGYITACNAKDQSLSTPAERRKNHGRIYYGLSNVWKEKLDREPGKSQRLKIEHRIIEQHFPKGSLFTVPTRKTELVSVGKPDTTKEILTKENETKETSSFLQNQTQGNQTRGSFVRGNSEQEDSYFEIVARQVFQEKRGPCSRETDADTSRQGQLPEELFSENAEEAAGLSSEAVAFTASFTCTAKQFDKTVNAQLSPQDRTRLEKLLGKHKGLDWTPVLELFFQCDLGHVTRRNYSLLAFLNSCNLFLIRIPGATTPSTLGARRSGWRKTFD